MYNNAKVIPFVCLARKCKYSVIKMSMRSSRNSNPVILEVMKMPNRIFSGCDVAARMVKKIHQASNIWWSF